MRGPDPDTASELLERYLSRGERQAMERLVGRVLDGPRALADAAEPVLIAFLTPEIQVTVRRVLYSPFGRWVYFVVYRRRPGEEVQTDLVNDCWVRLIGDALRRWVRKGEPPRIEPWVARVARNATLDHLNQVKRTRPPEAEPDALPPGSVHDRVEARRFLAALRALLHDTERQVFDLYYVEKVPLDDIAERLGRTRGYVQKRVLDGIRTKAKQLRDRWNLEP